MKIFTIWHGIHCITVKLKLQFISTWIGRTKLPVAIRIFTQFPMMLENETCMTEPLYQRIDFYVPFFRITTDRFHLLLADCIGSSHFRTAGVAQFIFQFPNDGIHFITCQLINRAIIIFDSVQMMLGIKVNGTVRDFGIVRYAETRNRNAMITTILHQLLQCLTAIKQSGLSARPDGHSFRSNCQYISFG